VAAVTVSPAEATLVQNATRTFTASALDANSVAIPGVAFTWTSSDPSIATVSSSGAATGVSVGDVTITATAPNNIAGSATLHIDAVPPRAEPSSAHFSEIHYDNFGGDVNEGIEIEGIAGTDVTGWSVVLYNGTDGKVYDSRTLAGTIPASCDGRGVVALLYPENGIQNGAPDAVALVDAAGRVLEFISYEGTLSATDGPAAGQTAVDILAAQNASRVGLSLQRYSDSDGKWFSAASTFGLCNGVRPPPGASTIAITGRAGSDPALPVGFQDQLFATLTDASGATVPTTVSWSSDSPSIASIDQFGVLTALAEGTAVLRATAPDGTTGTLALPVRIGVASSTALYVGNAAFGEPSDSDPSDDFIVRYPEFTASYSPTRGTPNWVAYELDPTHYGPEDRCDCFTFDPELPSAFMRYTTADYTGAGAFHGYGIDRGHLARSFDRTAGSLDNARSFYFTNIVPQTADLNQGPWASFETFLGNLARTGGMEVYIVTGVAGSIGTVKNEGKIVIPASTWKVAVVMPHDRGLADVIDYRDLEVIAVNMPNEPGVRNVHWENYSTTVDAIETLTGYDLLALLPDRVEDAVESGRMPPFAVTDGVYSSLEGSAVAMSAAASFDPNGGVIGYEWSFGDGVSTTGQNVSHTYAQDGIYTVTLVVTDNDGLTDTITTTATVGNVAPLVAGIVGATDLLPGETYAEAGTFSDPGADAWSGTVNFGDGGGAVPLAIAGQAFALSHTYHAPGAFTVTLAVNDGSATSVATTTVTVMSVSDGIAQVGAAIDGLAATGTISASAAHSMRAKLAGAMKKVAAAHRAGAVQKLESAVHALDALVRSGRLAQTEAAATRMLLTRTIAALSR
jgi:endonuclease G